MNVLKFVIRRTISIFTSGRGVQASLQTPPYARNKPLHPLRLDGGDRHRVDDVLNGGTARKVVHGLAQTLQHGTNGGGTRRLLHSLVGVVAGVQVGENKHGRLARHLAIGHLG